jgi:Domain of unknown function (DUF3943)
MLMLPIVPGAMGDVAPPRAAQIALAPPSRPAPPTAVPAPTLRAPEPASPPRAPEPGAPPRTFEPVASPRAFEPVAPPRAPGQALPPLAGGAGRGGPRWGPPIAHSLAVMAGTRLAEAYLYPEPFARTDPGFWGERYRDAFTKPPIFEPARPLFRWDGDPWIINVVGHGLMGSEYYARARACRFSHLGALAFAAGASAVWEYAFEGNGVRPSALDLVYTPLAGAALGEARYQAWRAAAGVGPAGLRVALRVVLDPFGELERGAGVAGC